MKIHSRKFIPFIFILLLCVAGCHRWDRPECSKKGSCFPAFTGDQPCQAPCWQRITPGLTTIDETLAILDSLEFVNDPSMTGEIHVFDEQIAFSAVDGAWVANISFIEGKVAYIIFWGELSTTFGEAEKLFASPQKVLYYRHSTADIVLDIFNLDEGIAYGTSSAYMNKSEHENFLSPESKVNVLRFWDAQYWDLFVEEKVFHWGTFKDGDMYSNLQDWKGYGKTEDLYILKELE